MGGISTIEVVFVFEINIGIRNRSVETKILEDFQGNGSSAEATFAVKEMMFAGIKAEIEPVDAVPVGFELFGTAIEIKINVFKDVAHYYDFHAYDYSTKVRKKANLD